MINTIPNIARALTIGIAAILAFNAANASDGGTANVKSATSEYLTYVVRFADLDVSKMEGAKTLYARLGFAAKIVCAPLDSAGSWGEVKHRTCMNKAIADAVASVNSPLLSQYHQFRTTGDKAPVQLAMSK
jgi:UrcA family protein